MSSVKTGLILARAVLAALPSFSVLQSVLSLRKLLFKETICAMSYSSNQALQLSQSEYFLHELLLERYVNLQTCESVKVAPRVTVRQAISADDFCATEAKCSLYRLAARRSDTNSGVPCRPIRDDFPPFSLNICSRWAVL